MEFINAYFDDAIESNHATYKGDLGVYFKDVVLRQRCHQKIKISSFLLWQFKTRGQGFLAKKQPKLMYFNVILNICY